jgi:hypothetical protein
VASAQDSGDDLGHGVARISVINGDVSVRRGDTGDWIAAAVNTPLVVLDSVTAGDASRAEIQLDYANMIRLAANTEVRFSELEYGRYQVQIARGTVTFSVLRDSDSDVDLSTPNVSVRPLEKGRYRVSVRDDGTTEITVRSGKAEIFTPSGVETLPSGKTMVVRGTASDPVFQIIAAVARDDWDNWNEQRDKELKRSGAYKYVSRDIYGAEDLDSHGEWVYVPPYGWVWSPRVATGWAPYRYGRWSWLDWYGWNWISYDPWGWAPYHYGRWFNHGPYGWCWWPGSIHVRHHWRPALVGFFGWNSYSGFSFGVGFGFGNIGGVPRAPYATYYPWYGRRYYHGYRHGGYIDNSVNIVNNVNITNIYRNARINNGVTAVNGADFGKGRVSNVYRASSNELRRTSLVRGQLPVVPQRESLRVSDREVRTAALPSSRSWDKFATRRQVSQPQRVPFDQQQRGMERVAQRTLQQQVNPRTAQGSGRSAAPASRAGQSAPSRVVNAERTAQGRSTATRSASQGWRRFGEPVRSSSGSAARPSTAPARSLTAEPGRSTASPATGRSATRSTGSTTSAWRRFGQPSRTAQPSSGSSAAQRVAPSTSRSTGAPTSTSSWRTLGSGRSLGSRQTDTGLSQRSTTSRSSGVSGMSRATTPPSRYESSRGSSTRYERGSSSRSLPISPPIIRERSSPRTGASSRSSRSSGSIFSGSGGSGGSSRSSRPSGSISRSSGGFGGATRSAPRSSSGMGRSSSSGGSFGRSSGASSGGRMSAPSGRSGGGASGRSGSGSSSRGATRSGRGR